MTTTLKAILLITVAVAACGGSSAGGMQSTTPSPPKTLVVDSGGTACTKEQQQSIVFSGALSGTLTCATGKPECSSLFKGKVSNKSSRPPFTWSQAASRYSFRSASHRYVDRVYIKPTIRRVERSSYWMDRPVG